MSSQPLISIVIPSYNQGQYLEKTLQSVIGQKYPRYELIVIDGGSTDQTVKVIKSYEKYITYWISEKDSGQAEAVNKGISKATGDYIGWQNSDDLYLDGCFRDFSETAKEYPGYDIYYADRYTIDDSNIILWKKYMTEISLFYYKYRSMVLANQTTFFSREMANTIGLLDEKLNFALDNEFFLRALLNGYKAYHVPRFWGALRHHGKSKTGLGNQDKWSQERLYIRKKHSLPTGISYRLCNVLSMFLRLYYLAKSPTAMSYTILYHLNNMFPITFWRNTEKIKTMHV